MNKQKKLTTLLFILISSLLSALIIQMIHSELKADEDDFVIYNLFMRAQLV